MKTLQIELPDQLAGDVEKLVETGRFESTTEVVRTALREFVATRHFELLEEQQKQDVAWALREDATTA